MRYINRFLLFLYTLAIAVISLGVIVLCLHIVPMYVLVNELKFIISQQETLIGAGLVFLWSIYLLGCALSSTSSTVKREKEISLLQGSDGNVKISVTAVEELTERISLAVEGVRSVKSDISIKKQADAFLVEAELKVSIGQNYNVISTSEAIRTAVGNALHSVVGFTDFSVNVSVIDVSNASPSKKQRVV